MDFDLNAALNDYRAYICALESCPQPAASAPPLRPLSSGALINTSARRPTAYQDLPPELIERIGDYVPVQEVGNFSAVDRRTYHATQSRRLVYRYWQRANQVESLESINRILEEMDGALKDPAQHVEALEALRQRLKELPWDEQSEAFKRVYMAAQRIPKDGVRIQKAMLCTLDEWLGLQRAEAFDFAHALAEQRGPGQDNVWRELAIALWSLPSSSPAFIERYQVLLARLPSLSVAEQAELIPSLSGLLRRFDRTNPSLSALHALLRDQALRLPPSYQGEAVGTLAVDAKVLPEAERLIRYVQMRDLALSLPDDQWGLALRHLPAGLNMLPPEQRIQELALFERHLARVPEAQRARVAHGLLSSTRDLDKAQSQRVWLQVLSLFNGRGEAALSSLLTGIPEYYLPRQWRFARREVIRFMEANRFSEAARARILDSVPWWQESWLRDEPS
ncbi:hypothetical protein [Mycetohabitans sp. B6]|uniref:hypothetical protein n=1 Tax=Mycetohabitans sp. B6 TaxID=2841843 RepID=UPI001F1A2FA8|nr:hypothetical protein [Mycetohabitans sp. B6]MCG1046048.1 hypothetical protein [Mycetohabitans sp. B6]